MKRKVRIRKGWSINEESVISRIFRFVRIWLYSTFSARVRCSSYKIILDFNPMKKWYQITLVIYASVQILKWKITSKGSICIFQRMDKNIIFCSLFFACRESFDIWMLDSWRQTSNISLRTKLFKLFAFSKFCTSCEIDFRPLSYSSPLFVSFDLQTKGRSDGTKATRRREEIASFCSERENCSYRD